VQFEQKQQQLYTLKWRFIGARWTKKY